MVRRLLLCSALVLFASAGNSQVPPEHHVDQFPGGRGSEACQFPGEHACQDALTRAMKKIDLQQQLIDKLEQRIAELEKSCQ